MTIQAIYSKYEIMPTLQEHMRRVAAVAKHICEYFDGPPIDKTSVVAACLLHDMGNILKFDLTRFPEFLEPQGLSYWENVQEKFREQYGRDEHVATELILEEIGVTQRIKELVQAIGFFEGERNLASDDYEKKICDYADTRVDPHGVVSLDERLLDLEKRYGAKYSTFNDKEKRKHYGDIMRQIESQLFDKCSIAPSQITNEALNGTITSLNYFVVPLKEMVVE